MLPFLNILLFVLHTFFLVFNLTGWIWKRTRRWHLASIGLTLFSWLGLGYWYGWGYCIITDWHWQIRREMGFVDPVSYTELLMVNILGLPLSTLVVDVLTAGGLALATILTVWLNIRDYVTIRKSLG
jgi:hypothetical protein